MSGYSVLHLDKSPGNESAMTDHIERKVIHPNVNLTRTHLNKELIEFPEGVTNRTEAIQHRIENAGLSRKVGKNQVQVIRVMLTGSHEDMLKIQQEGRLDDWCQDNITWLKKEFGEENLVAATLHLDEKTPHIHASVVPIVQGERRQKKSNKKEEKTPKKKYKKKNPNRPRLCCDDVMSREKLTAYQDSYGEAMAKYGLERGIKGSEARHITTSEFYREQKVESNNLQIDISLLLEQKEAEQKALEQIKAKQKTEQLKKSAIDIGSTIVDGIGSMMGTSKVKKQQREIDNLTVENNSLIEENTSLKQTNVVIQKSYEAEIKEREQEIKKIHDWFPDTPFLIKWGEFCHKIGFNKNQAKDIVNMRTIRFSGELYSSEHNRRFKVDNAIVKFEKGTDRSGAFNLLINNIGIIQWFREKYREFQEKIGIKINEPRKQQQRMR